MKRRWVCPYCSITQTVVDSQITFGTTNLAIDGQQEGHIACEAVAIGCSNEDCARTAVTVTVGTADYGTRGAYLVPGMDPLFTQRVLPQGFSKPQPDYIPVAIREDYREACLIRDLSPKASATLIRRCLQGMIRDFAGISKRTLNDEILALRKALDDGSADRSVTHESVDAIDHIRKIGNIGAHMERDIDLIIDVDPGEAQKLIEIVEMLFDEWYVARHSRQLKLAQIRAISEDKEGQKAMARLP